MSFLLSLVAIWFVYTTLSGRIKVLEDKLTQCSEESGRSSQSSVMPTTQPTVTMPTTPPAPVPVTTQQNRNISTGSPASQSFDLFAWLAQDFFVKLGALLLLLAFGWFVSYAFANNWIGPAGRITLGLLAGVVFMGVGVWRIAHYRHQGSIFTVLGSSIVLLTVFAAREIYDFFTPATALLLMFLSVVFVAYVAVRYRSAALALAGLTLGAIAPFFTNAEPNVMALLSYGLVLVVGSLWVQRWIGAVALPVAAFLIVVFYGLPYLFAALGDTDQTIALLFSFVFTVIFFISNTVSVLARTDPAARQAQQVLALGTGLYLVAWVTVAADPVWHSLLYAAWMIVFATGAYIVSRRTDSKSVFYLYAGVSIGLLAAATAAEVSGSALTIAYTVEVLTLLTLAQFYTESSNVQQAVSWLFIGPVVLSLSHMVSNAWQTGFMHADFFALLILTLALLVAGQILVRRETESVKTIANPGVVLTILAAGYAVILVWLVAHSVLSTTVAVMVSLFVYTIGGISAYVYGTITNKDILRLSGGGLLALVVLRLLLVDVWDMELVGRIITFFGIGLLLLSTAFIRKH